MRQWDLATGAAKLELAMETLKKIETEAAAQWNDRNCREFREKYLVPLEARVDRAVVAIHRMAEVLAKAEHECGSQ